VANAVNVDAVGIRRAPADSLRDDSDLGSMAVTVEVPRLPVALVEQALSCGEGCARQLQAAGLIVGATLVCQGQARLVLGAPPLASSLQSLKAA
jgi:uncharacterized protein